MAMSRRRSTLPRDLAIVVLALAIALGVPRVVRAYSALQWTRYYTAQPPDAAGQRTRSVARWVQTAVAASAPLPWAAEACRLALDYGGREEALNPAASLALYERLHATLDPLVASRWRRLGLEELLNETRRREESLRARGTPPKA
jgi:hypothetical protein